MPTYEYQCGTCGHRFEKYQSFSDAPLKECPECGREIRKVFNAAGIIFKGSGWYINDSRKSNGSETKSAAKAESATETKAETKSEAKTENKSEAKSESATETKSNSN